MSNLDNLLGKKVQIRELINQDGSRGGYSPNTLIYLGVVDYIREQLIRVVNCVHPLDDISIPPNPKLFGGKWCDADAVAFDTRKSLNVHEIGTRWFNMNCLTFQSIDELDEK